MWCLSLNTICKKKIRYCVVFKKNLAYICALFIKRKDLTDCNLFTKLHKACVKKSAKAVHYVFQCSDKPPLKSQIRTRQL
jgi:hypothetical protein